MAQEWLQADYVISNDSNRLDILFIHDFLSNTSYWAKDRSLDLVSVGAVRERKQNNNFSR
jgi:hypothetical protein